MKTTLLAIVILLAACGGSQGGAPSSASPRAPGPLGDTWTRDGTTWHRQDVAGPAPRYLAALAYDAPRRDFVLFGGQTAKGTSGETWTFDGTTWTAMIPAHHPPPRRNAAMAYDPSRQVVVLYGGLVPDQGEGREAADTWTWNGADWAQAGSAIGAPGVRQSAGMVTAGDHVVLFGGHIGNIEYFGDAWTWNGATWARIDRDPRPQGRGGAAIAWDRDDSSLFVYGGLGIRQGAGPGNQGLPLGDAWSMKNGAWTQLPTPGRPTAAYESAIWDWNMHRAIVMFGIECPDPVIAGWSWDGSGWSPTQVGVTARWGAAVAQDDKGGALVFGGSDESGC
jgi:hypothetical protein